MKQSNIKTPLVFRIGVALLFALVITCNMMGGLYARYLTRIEGNNTVKVAVFDVVCSSSDDGSSKELEIGSADTVTYTFTVQNNSDVSIQYTIEVAGLPSGVTVSGNSDTFSLGFGGESRSHTLTFSVSDSASEVTNQKISVSVNASQTN